MRVYIKCCYLHYGSLKIEFEINKFGRRTESELIIPCSPTDNHELIAFVFTVRDICARFKVKPKSLEIATTSKIVVESLNSGVIKSLMLNGWKDADGEALVDKDLWSSALALYTSQVRSLNYVELVDQLKRINPSSKTLMGL